DFTALGELDRIAEQVEQHLPDPQRIAEHAPGYAVLDRLHEAQAAPPCQWRLQRANTGHQGAYLERPGIQRQATRLQPGDVERIVEQPQQVGAGLADRLGATPDRKSTRLNS